MIIAIFAEKINDSTLKNNIPISKLLSWLWRNFKGARKQSLLTTFIGIADVACQMLWVLACKQAIEIATGEADGSLLSTGIFIGTLMLIEITSRICNRWIKNILGVKATNRLRLELFSRLLRSEWLYLQKLHTGDIINRLEGDVSRISALITETIPSVIIVIVQFIASFVLLFSLSPMLASIVVVILPICLFISRIYVRRMRSFNRDIRQSDSRIQAVLQESLQHKALIMALEQNESTAGELSELQENLHNQVRRKTKFSLQAYTFTQIGFAGGYLTAFLWGVSGLARNSITFGAMSAFLQLVGLIQRPTIELSQYIPNIIAALTATERLKELEDIPEERQGERIILGKGTGVRFSNVEFFYDDSKEPIFKNFNFDFSPGSSTAIVGETGAGKTTLIRLMVALIRPNSGEITIYNDGKQHSSSPATRGNFVYIPQGNSLVSGTIRDNLLMGNPDATDEMLHEALHTACADFVLSLPQGIDTPVAEQGSGLSEGQAQRIAVARSILRPGSILILDEITSALDEETEKELLHRLTSQESGKTLIFVTHRPAVMQYCTQVLKISNVL